MHLLKSPDKIKSINFSQTQNTGLVWYDSDGESKVFLLVGHHLRTHAITQKGWYGQTIKMGASKRFPCLQKNLGEKIEVPESALKPETC